MINKRPREQTFNHIFIARIERKRFDITIKDGRFSSIVESGQEYGELARQNKIYGSARGSLIFIPTWLGRTLIMMIN